MWTLLSKKRILDKTETAAQSLRLLYDQKATIIKNLIVFNDGVEKKTVRQRRRLCRGLSFLFRTSLICLPAC